MKVNKIGESKFEHEAAGFSAQVVGSLFVCFFTSIGSYWFKTKMVSAEVFSLTYAQRNTRGITPLTIQTFWFHIMAYSPI